MCKHITKNLSIEELLNEARKIQVTDDQIQKLRSKLKSQRDKNEKDLSITGSNKFLSRVYSL